MLPSNANSFLVVGVNRCVIEATEINFQRGGSCIGRIFLVPVPFCVCELVDAVECLKIIRKYVFEASLAFLAYQPSAEIDREDIRFVGWLPHKFKTGDVLNILER